MVDSRTQPARRLLGLALFAALFAALLLAGNAFYYSSENVATFWPATGFVLATLLLVDVRDWRWIGGTVLVVQFLVDNQVYDRAPGTAMVFAAINFLEPALGALLTRRFVRPPIEISTLREVLTLTAAILLSTAVAAFLGARTVVALAPGAAYWTVWQVWWSADLLGGVIVAPAVLSWSRLRGIPRVGTRTVVEIALALGALGAMSAVVFTRPPHVDRSILDSPYAVLPALLWIAIRFGPRGLTTAMVLVSTIAIASGDLGRGPFADQPLFRHVISLQWFLGVTGFTLLSLTVVAWERRRYRDSLEASELRYRRFLERSTEGIYRAELRRPIPRDLLAEQQLDLFYRDAYLAEVNDAFAHLRGYGDRRELADVSLETIYPRTDADARESLIACIRGRRRAVEWRTRARDVEGREVVLQESAMAIEEDDGVVRIWGVVRDVTELDRAERSLRDSEEKYRVIAETGADAIVTIDENSRILYANPAVATVFGYAQEELMGDSLVKLMPEDLAPAHLTAYARYRRTGEKGMNWTRFETTARHRSGRLFPIEVAVGEPDSGGPRRVTGICRDITERREAEEILRRYEVQLRGLASEISLVEQRERRKIAAALHDHIVQNLALARLKLASVHALAAGTPLAEEFAALRELVDETIQDARSLLNDLSPPVLYELGFLPALDWLAERMERQFDLEVEIDVENARDMEPLDDDARIVLFQAVREALINVAKHAGVRSASVSLTRVDGVVCVRVADRGDGFDPSALGPEWSESGGFGLFSIRERLRAMGGQIEIVSARGDGTTVTLTAPLPAGTARGVPAR